jgi:ATP-dependent Clp protease ATP-binding subunit ClpA
MFERFTERARQVVVEAQVIARELRHEQITPWTLLLGLYKAPGGIAADYLPTLQPYESLIAAVKELDSIPTLPESPVGQIGFSQVTKQALDNALREALSMGHNYIGTEHLLLGLCRAVENGTDRLALFPPYSLVQQDVIAILSGARKLTPPLRIDWTNDMERDTSRWLEAVAKVTDLLDRDNGVPVADLRKALADVADATGFWQATIGSLNVVVKRP